MRVTEGIAGCDRSSYHLSLSFVRVKNVVHRMIYQRSGFVKRLTNTVNTWPKIWVFLVFCPNYVNPRFFEDEMGKL